MGALLVHGQFLGRSALSSRAAGFICAELEATVPEDEVATHTHAEGHFVLVRSGHYVSTAQGAPEVAGAGLDHIVASPAYERIVADAARHDVVAVATVDESGSRTA